MLFHSFLLLDVGNSRIKWAVVPFADYSKAASSALQLEGEMPTEAATAEAIATLKNKHSGCSLLFSSVVPKISPLLRRFFKRSFYEVTSELPELGFTFDYPNPREIGADRLAAATAVVDGPAIIVSCGTAVAFSVLDAKGRFCGGAIAPGLHTQLAALLQRTAQLPQVSLNTPSIALARSTADAIRAGVLLSFQGGVKEITHRLAATFPPDNRVRVVLTGGDAEIAALLLDRPHEVRPLLVLEGLRIIGCRCLNR